MSTADEIFMREALRLAETALHNGFQPIGAVVTFKDKIIGRGTKRGGRYRYLQHAEMLAISEAFDAAKDLSAELRRNGSGVTLYSTLEPCIMCFGTSIHTPVDRVVYAMEDPEGGAARLRINGLSAWQLRRYPQVTSGILRAEARALMQRFVQTSTHPRWRNPKNPLVARTIAKLD